MEYTNDLLVAILIVYSVISLIISILLICCYNKNEINPFKDAIDTIKDIETIGDLIIIILLTYAWLLAILFYGVIKIFYNRFNGYKNKKEKIIMGYSKDLNLIEYTKEDLMEYENDNETYIPKEYVIENIDEIRNRVNAIKEILEPIKGIEMINDAKKLLELLSRDLY